MFVYILEHTKPGDNRFTDTYQEIMKGAGCCRQMVASTLKKLQKANFMRKVQTGVWMVNPDIIVNGNDHKRNMLLLEYQAVKPEK